MILRSVLRYAAGLSVCLLLVILASCKAKTVYVPVESVRVEYRDKLLRDSIHLYDSVLVKMKGDTVWLEKYKYLYRDKVVRDSVFKTDSIAVPYPVVEVQEVNRLTSFQSFQIWCGRGLLLFLLGYLVMRRFKRSVWNFFLNKITFFMTYTIRYKLVIYCLYVLLMRIVGGFFKEFNFYNV